MKFSVPKLNALSLDSIRRELGPKRGDLFITWLGSCDQNLDDEEIWKSIQAVTGLGPGTIVALRGLVDGMPRA